MSDKIFDVFARKSDVVTKEEWDSAKSVHEQLALLIDKLDKAQVREKLWRKLVEEYLGRREDAPLAYGGEGEYKQLCKELGLEK